MVSSNTQSVHIRTAVSFAKAQGSVQASFGRDDTRSSLGSEVTAMLWTISVSVIVMWLLGMVTSYTMSGFIHILLVLAAVTTYCSRVVGSRRVV